MTHKTKIAIALAAVLAALLLWWHHSEHGAPGGKAADTARSIALGAAGLPLHARRPDPRRVPRAQVAGTITDDTHAPIAHARVCLDLVSDDLPDTLARDPRCTFSDAAGAYVLGDLYASEVRIVAMARGFLPAQFHPDGDRRRTTFELHGGEHRTGVDLVLARGGVELTGTVSDISGGPISHAQVRANTGWQNGNVTLPEVDSDDAGTFTMWVRPGEITVTAVADGYAAGTDSGRAPGKFQILLTPESSLSGIVVDARTGAPVSGVHVEITTDESPWSSDATTDITDDQGHFHADRLEPGRYVAIARSPVGYGHSDGSTRVALAQHVDGVVVKLYPAVRVEGRVVLPDEKRTTCQAGWVRLHRLDPERFVAGSRDPDGTLHADGVLPGTYEVEAGCDRYHSRAKYPRLEVKDKDVTGLEWEVDPGAVIHGRIVTKSGAPIEGAFVSARSVGGKARAKTGWATDRSAKDGSYDLAGLAPGDYQLDVESEQGLAPKDGWKVSVVAASSEVTKDLVLDDGGIIRGTVVDTDGKPLAAVHVRAEGTGSSSLWATGGNVRTTDDGSFELDDVRAGDYRVIASRTEWSWGSGDLKKPGTTDDTKQGERATVSAGQTASVRLVVESTSGTIRGTVVDADGKPVGDAFVSASRESDAAGARASVRMARWSSDERPVLTGIDGSFTISQLPPGNYTVLAQRRGGGEASAEHVPAGGTTRLQIARTGSIEGTAHRDGGAPVELEISLSDQATGYYRSERFFETAGHYTIKDLPAGHFTITYSAEGGQKQKTVDLADGQHEQGVDVELDPLVTITGRVVDIVTHQPVSGLYVVATPGKTSRFTFAGGDDDEQNITDDAGRFSLARGPRGEVTISGFAKDWATSNYSFMRAVRDVEGTGTVDVGDLGIVRRRVKPGDPVGDLGVHWAQQDPGAAIDAVTMKVAWIDPAGPAAKSGLVVGDVVTSIDGVDVTGANAANGWMLMQAAPGTTLQLGLARGTTVAVTLAPQS